MKELDWANLPFGYMKTDYNVSCLLYTSPSPRDTR